MQGTRGSVVTIGEKQVRGCTLVYRTNRVAMAGLAGKDVTEVKAGGYRSSVQATAGAEGLLSVVGFFT